MSKVYNVILESMIISSYYRKRMSKTVRQYMMNTGVVTLFKIVKIPTSVGEDTSNNFIWWRTCITKEYRNKQTKIMSNRKRHIAMINTKHYSHNYLRSLHICKRISYEQR